MEPLLVIHYEQHPTCPCGVCSESSWGDQMTELLLRKTLFLERLNRMEEEMILETSMDEDPNKGMVPASELSIAKVLKRVRVDDDGESPCDRNKKKTRITSVSEGKSCTICMEEFETGSEQAVSKMPCEHAFHHECIVTWLKQSHYCPVCRFEVPTTDD